MIYSAKSLTENSLFSATDNRDTLLEDSYMFLYESEYNFNTIVSEINSYEAEADRLDSVLVLEGVDIKDIFTKIKNAIITAWNRFISWLKDIKAKIKANAEKRKAKRNQIKNLKSIMKNLSAEQINKLETRMVDDIDFEALEDIADCCEAIDLEKIEKCESVEEVEKVKEEQIAAVVNAANISASNTSTAEISIDKLRELFEAAIGLGKRVSYMDKYRNSDPIDPSRALVPIDKSTQIAERVSKSATTAIDKCTKMINAEDKYEDYKTETAKANLLRFMSNVAMLASSVTSKANYVLNNQVLVMEEGEDGVWRFSGHTSLEEATRLLESGSNIRIIA